MNKQSAIIWVWINTYENTIFRGLFTSINPSYFDVNRRCQGFDPSPFSLQNLQFLRSKKNDTEPATASSAMRPSVEMVSLNIEAYTGHYYLETTNREGDSLL